MTDRQKTCIAAVLALAIVAVVGGVAFYVLEMAPFAAALWGL